MPLRAELSITGSLTTCEEIRNASAASAKYVRRQLLRVQYHAEQAASGR